MLEEKIPDTFSPASFAVMPCICTSAPLSGVAALDLGQPHKKARTVVNFLISRQSCRRTEFREKSPGPVSSMVQSWMLAECCTPPVQLMNADWQCLSPSQSSVTSSLWLKPAMEIGTYYRLGLLLSRPHPRTVLPTYPWLLSV